MNIKRNTIFIIAVAMVSVFLIWFAFTTPIYILDCAFAYLMIGFFYFVSRTSHLKSWLVILGLTPFIIELIAVAFGFFALSLWGLGFDKMLHFFNALIITVLLYFLLSKNYRMKKVVAIPLAILVVLGFGLMGEILEFLGQRYFHIYGPGMFSQGDLLPSTLKNDLTNYDTWWDMIMDFLGAVAAGIFLAFKKKIT